VGTGVCHPSYPETINRRIYAQAYLGIDQDPISKITKAKKGWGMAQVIGHIP
jgi:hypothetical protein